MRWTVESEQTLYRDEWLDVRIADVRLPDGTQIRHRLFRTKDAAHLVMLDRGRVLLLWRHRFITDTWGWEIPGGGTEPGEVPIAAAAREAEEETGWRPAGPLHQVLVMQPMPGLAATRHCIYRAEGAEYVGSPAHDWESDRIAWTPLEDVRRLIDEGHVTESTTLVALLSLLDQPGPTRPPQ